MTDMTQRQEEMLAEAERVNEERMQIMRELATQVAHRVDLERQVAEAEKEERRLTAAAEKAGWTRRQVLRVAKPPKAKTSTTKSSSSSSNSSSDADVQEEEKADHRQDAGEDQTPAEHTQNAPSDH